MSAYSLNAEQVAAFGRDGYLFVPNLLDAEETQMVRDAARADARLRAHAMHIADTRGRSTNLSLWNHPGDDVYGMMARSHRVVDAMEQLLGDEVYHYHSKLSAKEPKVGGAWEWHQDYGYWYQNGCLFPDMASVYIALDRATRENGCLQVIQGSHRLGRIEHGRFGDQTGADPERVQAALDRLALVYCEMEPGTGLYFHGNLLHASAANLSEYPRWGLLCCYNTRHNDPFKESHHPGYTPLLKVPDSAIKTMGAKGSGAGQDFLDPARDKTTGAGKQIQTQQRNAMSATLDYLPRLPVGKDRGIGCIGAGFIMADCHLVAYRRAGLNPVAIASRRVEHAREVAARHEISAVYADYEQLLADPRVEVVDVAVPPDVQFDVIRAIVRHRDHVRGILAQKPLGVDFDQARRIVELCEQAGITLAVNQNMRYDQSVRACRSLIAGGELGQPVFASIDMRAIPHWMPWQERLGWVTLRIMSIHHLDTFRYWFGNPERVLASIRPDPRTQQKFAHQDGICLYILEYADGLRAAAWDDVWAGPAREGAAEDISIRWRVEGTEGMARGTIGWPDYPKPTPSTLDYTTRALGPQWQQPRWNEVWFPDAFLGPMAELLCALDEGRQSTTSGRDNLGTMALVDACYRSAREHRAVELSEFALA